MAQAKKKEIKILKVSEDVKGFSEKIKEHLNNNRQLFSRTISQSRNSGVNKLMNVQIKMNEFGRGEFIDLLETCYDAIFIRKNMKTVVLATYDYSQFTYGSFGLGTRQRYCGEGVGRSTRMLFDMYRALDKTRRNMMVAKLKKIDADRGKKLENLENLLREVETIFKEIETKCNKTTKFKLDKKIRLWNTPSSDDDDFIDVDEIILSQCGDEGEDSFSVKVSGKDRYNDEEDETVFDYNSHGEFDVSPIFEEFSVEDIEEIVNALDVTNLEKRIALKEEIWKQFHSELTLASI